MFSPSPLDQQLAATWNAARTDRPRRRRAPPEHRAAAAARPPRPGRPMTPGVVTAHLDDVPAIVFDSDAEPDWKPLRHHLGIGAFGVNAWVAPEAGGQAIERHDEAPEDGDTNGHEELYVVLRGHARFTVGDEKIDAREGTLVFVADPALVREAIASEPTPPSS